MLTSENSMITMGNSPWSGDRRLVWRTDSASFLTFGAKNTFSPAQWDLNHWAVHVLIPGPLPFITAQQRASTALKEVWLARPGLSLR